MKVRKMRLLLKHRGYTQNPSMSTMADCNSYAKKSITRGAEMWHYEDRIANNPHHVGSRNNFSHWPHLRCPSLYELSPGLSEFASRSRVAVGYYRGHWRWHRRLCVLQRQQNRGYSLLPDQYPRLRILWIHSLLLRYGWFEVSCSQLSESRAFIGL